MTGRMKGGKKDKLSLKKASKASKEEILKQVLVIPVDLNETCDFKHPVRMKDQPLWKSEARSKDLPCQDRSSRTIMKISCEPLQTNPDHIEACRDISPLPEVTESDNNCGEGSKNQPRQTCPLCASIFEEDKLQQHISICMKSQFQYKKNVQDDISDEIGAQNLRKRKEKELLEEEMLICEFCQKDLSNMNLQRKTQHINRCVDKIEEDKRLQKEEEDALEFAKTAVLDCPMCGKHLKTDTSRRTHLKKCASSLSVPTEQMLVLMRKQEDERRATVEAGKIPANIRIPKSKSGAQGRKRKIKQPKDQLEEEIQLALAMSNSMAEEQKRQESQIYGQLQMADTLGKNQNGITKKSKKINGEQPLLIALTTEEKQRRLEQRVNLLLLPQEEDSNEDLTSTPDLPESKLRELQNRPMEDLGTQRNLYPVNSLWRRSCGDENDFDRAKLYYVKSLMPPVCVSVLKTGSKMKRLSEIPGRRRSCDMPAQKEELPPLDTVAEAGEDGVLVSTQTAVVLAELAEGLEDEDAMDTDGCTIQSSGFCLERPLKIHKEELSSVGDNLRRSLLALVDNPQGSDIQITTRDGDRLYGHSLLLSTRCPKILELAENGEIHLTEVCSEAVIAMLKFVYAGDVCLTQSIVQPLISVAKRFDLNELSSVIEKIQADNNALAATQHDETPVQDPEPDVEDILKAVFSESDSDNESEAEKEDSAISKEEYYDILCTQNENIRRINSRDETEGDMRTASNTGDLLSELISSDTEESPASVSDTSKVEEMLTTDTDIAGDRIDMVAQEERTLEHEQRTLPTEYHSVIGKQKSIEGLDMVDQYSDNSEISVKSNSQQGNISIEECGNTDHSFISNFSLEEGNEENNMHESMELPHNISGADEKQNMSGENKTEMNSKCSSISPVFDITETESFSEKHEDSSYTKKNSKNLDCSLTVHQNGNSFFNDEVILIETPVHSMKSGILVAPVANESFVLSARVDSSCSDLFDSPISHTNFDDSRNNEKSCKRQLSDSFSTPLPVPLSKRLKISTPVVCESSGVGKNRLSGLTTGHESMLLSPVANTTERKNSSLLGIPNTISQKSFETEIQHHSDGDENSSNSDDDDLKITGDNFAELAERSSGSQNFSGEAIIEIRGSGSDINKEGPATVKNTVREEEANNCDHHSLAKECEEDVQESPEDLNNCSRNGDQDPGVWEDFDDCGMGFAVACDQSSHSSLEPEAVSPVKPSEIQECHVIQSHDPADLPSVGESGPEDEDHNCVMWSDDNDLEEEIQQLSTETIEVKFKTPVPENRQRSKVKKWVPPSPFTPMQNYDAMPTPRLKKEVQKYGVRVLPKKKMLMLLKDIYHRTHAYETDSDCEEIEDEEGKGGNSDHYGISSSQESDISDLMEETLWNSEENGVIESQQSPVKDLPEKLTNYILSHSKLYERILQYEPLEFDILKKELAEAGIKCSMEKLQTFLDEKCITFTMKNMRKGRATKKRGKKKTTTKE